MSQFLRVVKDGFLGNKSPVTTNKTNSLRLSGGNAAAGLSGSQSYQKLIDAGKTYDAKVLKFFKVTLPVIALSVGLLMLIPITYQDYTLWDGVLTWLLMMLIMSMFIILPLSAVLFPSSDGIDRADIEALVAENRNKLRDFYVYYVNNTLNNGVPANEKVIIKPTNFKATTSCDKDAGYAVAENHKIKLVGMYQIEDKLTVVTVRLQFSKGYRELYIYEHDIEVFEAA